MPWILPFLPQSFADITSILKSLPNRQLKGVRLEIKSEFFGTDWAAGDSCNKATFVGTIDKWKVRDAVLMVKWDGWDQNKQCPLDALEKDADGDDLGLKLLDYANGDSAPVMYVAPAAPPARGRGAAAAAAAGATTDSSDDDDSSDDEPDNVIDAHGQTWKRVDPERVKTDSRTLPRTKPSLNAATPPKEIDSVVPPVRSSR